MKIRDAKSGYLVLVGDELRSHPMAKHGWINLHVYVCYSVYKENPTCHWCGKVLRWSCAPGDASIVNVDHVDGNTFNNSPLNLVPSCIVCNTRRSGLNYERSVAGMHARIEAEGEVVCECGRTFKHYLARNGHKPFCKGSLV